MTTLIFDLGGTLISNPFPMAIERVRASQATDPDWEGLDSKLANDFLDAWISVDRTTNFPFASHFLQEEHFITVAAWNTFQAKGHLPGDRFLLWQMSVLAAYRREALRVVASQVSLRSVKTALEAARSRGFKLAIGSNDRCWAPHALLQAAGIDGYFDCIAASEALNFSSPGAEKPSPRFFRQLETLMGEVFTPSTTYYIGDDETRDIRAVTGLPLTPVRYFGGAVGPAAWIDAPSETSARLSFSNFDELRLMINDGTFDTR